MKHFSLATLPPGVFSTVLRCQAARYETLQEDEVIVPSGKGHTDASAAAAMEKWGKNEIPEEKEPLWKMFVMQFVGTMPAMVRHAPRPSHDAPHRKAAHHASRRACCCAQMYAHEL